MTDTVTIRAEMISDIPEQAARSREAMKSMGDGIRQSHGHAQGATRALGEEMDRTAKKADVLSGGAMKHTTRAMRDMHEQGSRLREGLKGVGDTITERVRYPMQQLAYTMEAGTAAMVTFGLTTASSIQTATLALSAFTGSSALGGAAFQALHGLEGPVPLSGLTAGFEQLTQAGMRSAQIMPTLTALSNISAVSLNPTANFAGMSGALANIMGTGGLINPSDVNAFSSAGVDIYGMLARETGSTPAELRTRFLRAGTPMMMPGNFLSDLSSSQNATTGLAAYRNTWSGQMGQAKKAVGDLLATFETPLGNALTGASTKLGAWATETQQRFKTLGGSIGKDWQSNNMGALGTTLAQIFGDPKLAGDITIVTSTLHGFGQIMSQSVIPMAKDVLGIATPALKGFSDVLDWMGQHRAETEMLIGTLGGFIILSKIAQWTDRATTAWKAYSLAIESGGMMNALLGMNRGLLGLKMAEEGLAGTSAVTGAATAAGGEAAALGRGGTSGKLLGAAGALGAVAMGAPYLLHGLQGHGGASYAETFGTSTALGASIGSVVPGVGTAIGALGGAAIGGGLDLGKILSNSHFFGLFGGSHHTSHGGTTVHIQPGAIVIPGAGNPQKVANAIPGAINAQIQQFQQMQNRRNGG